MINRSARPTVSISWYTRSIRSAGFLWVLVVIIGSAMISLTDILGFKEVKGSWKMICIFLRISFICLDEYPTMSWPLYRISPDVGSSRRKMVLPSVDFPQPLSPTTPSVSPF